MKQKNLIVLALVTVVVVGAATLSRKSLDATAASVGEGTPFVEGLLDRVNDIARLEVTQGGSTVTVVQSDGRWGLEELGGYPARFKTVKQALMGVAELETVEAKTNNPERLGDLGLEEPDDSEEGATRLVLKDASSAVLASLLLGETKPGRSPKLYVRRTGEDQAWLVKGRIDLESDPLAWVDKQVSNIPADRVASIVTTHHDGEVLRVAKARKDQPNYTVAGVPEGRSLTAETIANSLGSALSYLSFDEVKPLDQVDFTTSPGASTVVRTWDGLVVEARLAEDGGQVWVNFDCRYDDPPEQAELPDSAEDEGDGHGHEHGEDGHDHGDEAPEEELPDPAVVKAELEELRAAVSGWAFVVPGYKQSSFDRRVVDFLLPEEPEPSESAPGELDEEIVPGEQSILEDGFEFPAAGQLDDEETPGEGSGQ